MPADTALVVFAIVAVFAAFAAVLMWADVYTNGKQAH